MTQAIEEQFPDPSSLGFLEYLEKAFPPDINYFMLSYHVAFSMMESLAAHGVTRDDFDRLGTLAVEKFLEVYR